MQTQSTTIRDRRFSQGQTENEAAREVAARLGSIQSSGRVVNHYDLDTDMDLKGEKFLVTAMKNDDNELALTFTSYSRITGQVVEAIIDGRTTYARASHSRRVLVTAAGHIFVEVDGRLALSPNKYEKATRDLLARLSALGLWKANQTAYTKANLNTLPKSFDKAA